MEIKKMKHIDKLRSLAQLDVDAIGAYEAAIKRVDHYPTQRTLTEFQADHARHVEELNALIVKLGGNVVESKPDLKGALIKGFTAVTSAMGNEAAILAMMGNEELTTHTYQAALKLDWEPDAKALIERNYSDEQRHLAWIKQAARERPWAQETGAHP